MKNRFQGGQVLSLLFAVAAVMIFAAGESPKVEPAKPEAKPEAKKEAKPKAKPKAKPQAAKPGSEKAKAQQKKKRNDEPEDQFPSPVISYVFPAGAQRGNSIETTANGTHLKGSDGVRITGSGMSGRVLQASDESVRIAVTVAPDAELGEHDLRLIGPGGVSNRYRFFVGELPELNEVGPNSDSEHAQPLPSLPVVVNGQVLEGRRDMFRFTAKAGQTLVCDVYARRILPFIADAVPAWLQASLTLYDANGRRLAYAADFRFRPDPLLVYHVPSDGEYLLEIRDALWRGRGDFVYRLTIGEMPCLTDIFPLGGRRGETTRVELHGFNLGAETLEIAVPADSAARRDVTVSRGGITSNALPFAVGDLPEIRRLEPDSAPNPGPAQPQKVAVPCVINGRIARPGEVHSFAFSVAAGRQLVMEVHARRLESPLDSVLTLLDARGQELAENDDTVDPEFPLMLHHADARLQYTFAAAGQYVLRLRDAQGKGGEEYAYRLVMAPPEPDFSVRATPDNVRLGPGETAIITLSALRKDAFRGAISISLPDLPPGFVASAGEVPAGQDQVALTITAPAGAPLGVFAPTILAAGQVGGHEVTRKAQAAESVMQAFLWMHVVPTKEYSLAVVKAPPVPLQLAVDLPAGGVLDLPQGAEVPLRVKVTREDGAKGGVNIAAAGLPQGITARGVFIAADQSEGTITLVAAPRLPVGMRQNLVLRGTLRSGGTGATRVLPAIPLQVVAAKP
jgi:hypothetical protein